MPSGPIDTGIFAQILAAFEQALVPGIGRLTPIASRILGILLLFELMRLGFGILFLQASVKAGLVRIVLRTGFTLFAILAYPKLINVAYQSFVHLGLLAGGHTLSVARFLDPGAYIGLGWEAGKLIYEAAKNNLGWTTPFVGPGYFLAWLLLMGCYAYMGLSIFILQVQFSLAVVGALVLLPFAGMASTSWIAQGAVAYPVNIGFRFFVKGILASIVFSILKTLSLANTETPTMLLMLTAVMAMAALFWKSDAIAGGLLAGVPAMTAGSLLQTAAGAAVMATGIGSIGRAAVHTGSRAVGSLTSGTTRLIGATSGAYQAGGTRGLLMAGARGIGSQTVTPTLAHLRQTFQSAQQFGNQAARGPVASRFWAGSAGTSRQAPIALGTALRTTLQQSARTWNNDSGHGGVNAPL